MENSYTFKITYGKYFICTTLAHTEYEAIDKTYYKHIDKFPTIERKHFKAKKL